MRKALALFTVIFLTFICIFTAIFIQINGEKENVVVTETVVYGDKSYAEGVTFNIDARLRKSSQKKTLQWKTDYTVEDEPITETDFRIAYSGINDEYEDFKNLSLYTTFSFTTTGSDFGGIFEEMGKAYEEMMKDAEPYTEQKRTILLEDYFDFYPLLVGTDFPGYHLYSDFHLDLSDAEKELIEKFNNYFKIPIVEGDKITISAIADENSNIIQWGTSSTDIDRYEMYITGPITDNKCFLYFSNRTTDGNIVDTSNIPEGYGIYCLPYTEEEHFVNFDFDGLKNIYPIDDESEIIDVRLSYDKNELYIVTKEKNKSILTVMDVDTYGIKLVLEIDSFENGKSYFNNIGSNFILFNTYDGTEDEFFYTVVSIDEDGNYIKEFVVPADYIGYNVKWDGQCLYLASTHTYNDDSSLSQSCKFGFTVYNKDGLKFHAKYDLSLATGYDGNYSSNYYVYLGRDNVDFVLPT